MLKSLLWGKSKLWIPMKTCIHELYELFILALKELLDGLCVGDVDFSLTVLHWQGVQVLIKEIISPSRLF
jgi:hypothetical protein